MPRSFGTHSSNANRDTSFEAIAVNYWGDIIGVGFTMEDVLLTDSSGINLSTASDMSWFTVGSSFTPILHFYMLNKPGEYDAYHFNFGTNTKFIGVEVLPNEDSATHSIAQSIISGFD